MWNRRPGKTGKNLLQTSSSSSASDSDSGGTSDSPSDADEPKHSYTGSDNSQDTDVDILQLTDLEDMQVDTDTVCHTEHLVQQPAIDTHSNKDCIKPVGLLIAQTVWLCFFVIVIVFFYFLRKPLGLVGSWASLGVFVNPLDNEETTKQQFFYFATSQPPRVKCRPVERRPRLGAAWREAYERWALTRTPPAKRHKQHQPMGTWTWQGQGNCDHSHPADKYNTMWPHEIIHFHDSDSTVFFHRSIDYYCLTDWFWFVTLFSTVIEREKRFP